MTVSRHKVRAGVAALLAGTVVLAGAFMPVAALQEEADTANAEAQEAPQSEGEGAKAGNDKKSERYFLGGRPRLKRQVGPALGEPRSILPQPYLPQGSVAVPAAPEQEAATGAAPLEGGELETPQADEADVAMQEAADIVAAGSSESSQPDDPFLTEGMLETLDPSGIPVLAAGEGFAPEFWAGQDRAMALEALHTFARPSTSPAMRSVARKVALSGFTLTRPDGPHQIDQFIMARLAVLVAHGDTEGYLALLGRLPLDHDWSALSRQLADGHLLAGRVEDACAIAAQERLDNNDPYWLRMAAFCRAVRGDRVGVDFQLGILEEVSNVPQTFYQLTDQILVESEQSSGPVLDSSLVLASPLRVDILEAVMTRLAKARVPLLADDFMHPLAAKAMLSLPGVEASQKLKLIGRGLADGWIGADTLATYVAAVPIAEDMALQALETAETDETFLNDVLLMALAGKATDPVVRDQARAIVQTRATNPDKAAYIMPVLAAMQGDDRALAFRSALLLGDNDIASALFTDARASSVGSDPAKDAMLGAAWPLVTLAGYAGAPAVTPDRLAMWWAGMATQEDRFAQAALLFTLLEATGQSVPDDIWAWAEEGEVQAAGPTISPAHWRKLLVLAAAGDRPGALLAAYRTTASGTISASYAGSLVGTLKDLGFEAEAHRLAVEIAVRRGL